MKFTTTASALQAPLKAILPAVGRQNPVLESVALSLEQDQLTMTCTNHEIRLSVNCSVATELEGFVLIPAAKFSKLIQAMGESSTLTFTVDGDKAVLKSGRSRFTLKTMPTKEFPTVEDAEDAETVTVDGTHLLDCLADVKHAMAKQDVRFYLNGALFTSTLNQLRIVATDGHRLSLRGVPCSVSDITAVVPRTSVSALERLLDEGDVELSFDKHSVRAVIGDVTFISQLIDGRYPDYTRVIPDESSNVCRVDASILKSAIQRVEVLSNDKYHGVRLVFDANTVTLSANNPEAEEAIDQIDCDYQGDVIEIGVNCKYLLDVLGVIGGDAVISLKDGSASMRIESDGESPAVHVVMPMRL